MAKLPGKFARINNGNTAIVGPFQWGSGFKRERVDQTNFESALSASGNNVYTEGTTGPLDSTFTMQGVLDDTVINVFFPDASLTIDFLFRKNTTLGYKGVFVDVLDFSTTTAIRETAKFTAQMQASGIVLSAA